MGACRRRVRMVFTLSIVYSSATMRPSRLLHSLLICSLLLAAGWVPLHSSTHLVVEADAHHSHHHEHTEPQHAPHELSSFCDLCALATPLAGALAATPRHSPPSQADKIRLLSTPFYHREQQQRYASRAPPLAPA